MQVPTIRVVEISSGVEMIINLSRYKADPDKYKKVGEKAPPQPRRAKVSSKAKLKE